jgi:hypothetical protein
MAGMNEQIVTTPENDDSKRRSAVDIITRTVNLSAGAMTIAAGLGSFYYINQYNKKIELIQEVDETVQLGDNVANAESYQQYRQGLVVEANNLHNNYQEATQMSFASLAIFSLALFCSTFRRPRTKAKNTES